MIDDISSVGGIKMTDTSDCESDAGASPSVSSDESADSDASNSSTSALKIVCETPTLATPKKKVLNNNATCGSSGTVGSSISVASSSVCAAPSTPVSTGRKPSKKQLCEDSSIISTPRSTRVMVSLRGTQSEPNNNVSSSTRKRKQEAQAYTSVENDGQSDQKLSPDSKRKRNKRRRTRSERNIRAGKAATTTTAPIVAEVEVEEAAVALDAEIDRVLEEKAIKNNLSATNVKSIIRHVITNNMVQKMIMSTMRKKSDVTDGNGGGSSDDDGLLEPKMTRAKTKELLGSKHTPLWPIVDSPVKLKKQPVSETHMLIQHDLPEDSSGDEYVPKETDIAHSDDESSSVASNAGDTPSPAVSTRVSTRRSLQADRSPVSDNLFKTPPPRPKALKMPEESAISRRTRSKHSLNDTPLEDLERRLVPPDITDDMYDWGDTDNEDYLAFLKDFLFPMQNNTMNEMGDDDEADPEYNVMEEDEDLHDREELRRDRAVKVPKKELNELVAELIEEYHVSSGDDLEDHDFTSLTSLTPFMNDSGVYSDDRGGVERSVIQTSVPPNNNNLSVNSETNGELQSASTSLNMAANISVCSSGVNTVDAGSSNVLMKDAPCTNPGVSSNEMEGGASSSSVNISPVQPEGIKVGIVIATRTTPEPEPARNKEPLFRDLDLQFLQHQMRQHIQLLAQSYVLTVSSEDESLKRIAKTSKTMIIELKNFAQSNGLKSNFAVCNMDHAWNLVNYWPHKFIQQSPIKKKILEEKYINEAGMDDDGNCKISHFPRHVVKIIAENETFVFNNLLPECYSQKSQEHRTKFSFSEDALICGGLEEMKPYKSSTKQMAEIISELLVLVHSPHQVYNRIRNLRKPSSFQYCHSNIKRYFIEGILPEPDRNILPVSTCVPLIQRSREGVSAHWATLLDHISDSSSYRWEEQLSKDPFLKSVSMKWAKPVRKKRKSGQSSDEASSISSSPLQIIDRVFPKGVCLIEKPDPDMHAIPLLNASGKPGAMILVPKYALIPPPQLSTPTKGFGDTQQQNSQSETTINCTQQLSASSSNSNVCLVGLNHLIRKSRETPRKAFSEESILPDRSCSPVRLINAPVIVNSFQVQCVGNPFSLPELSSSASGKSQVINLASLQTPLKREVFQKVAEQNDNQAICDSAISSEMTPEEVNFYETDNSNVVEEGTEVELTSDDDDPFEGELHRSETPVLVTLSGDEEQGESMESPVDAGGEGKGNSSPKKTDSGAGSSSKQGNMVSSCSSGATSTASSSRKPARGGGRGEDSDEDHDKKPPRKRSLPKDCANDRSSKEDEHGNAEKEKTGNQAHPKRHSSSGVGGNNPTTSSQMQPPPTKPIASTSQYHTSRSQPKKARKSPGNQTSRRVSKYNVTPADKMVQESSDDFHDVAEAYMETYLAKVHSATESKNPGLYTAFVQTLMEAGEVPVNQAELHAKMKVLLKDYPDLLKEFESFLDPTFSETDEPSTSIRPTAHEQTISQMKFIQQLQKFTEKCPQLMSKIMNKLKSLKEFPNLNDKEVVTALEPFLIGNPVMMDSFKTLFPSVYRPQSVSSSIDFEEIELDLEDPPRESSDDFETVKLPDETEIPASSTCPCCCHTKTSDPSFKNRLKHCRKCSLKFQDGKLFVHNGRVMRPVSVELTPAGSKTTPPSSSATTGRPCNALHHDKKKEPHSQAQSSKSKEFKEPEVAATNAVSSEKKSHHHHHPHAQSCSVIKPPVVSKHAVTEEILDIEHKANRKLGETSKLTDCGESSTLTFRKPQQQQHLTPAVPDVKKPEWTEEEDIIILSTCQLEPSLQVAWRKIAARLPHRSLDLIKSRCLELIDLIKKASEDKPS